MKIDNANLSTLNSTGRSAGNRVTRPEQNPSGDDIHFSELLRSLRSLVPDSPERQERIEQLARSYANGTYELDAEATAGKLIDDTLRFR